MITTADLCFAAGAIRERDEQRERGRTVYRSRDDHGCVSRFRRRNVSA